jgi:hypothetical protein
MWMTLSCGHVLNVCHYKENLLWKSCPYVMYLHYHFYLHWGLISFIFQGQHSQVKIINLQIEIKAVDELLHRTIKCIQDRIFTRDFLCNDRHLNNCKRNPRSHVVALTHFNKSQWLPSQPIKRQLLNVSKLRKEFLANYGSRYITI